MLCIGHRGACGHEPENTLRSVRRALELGVDGIEIDVQLVDGELVVLHDARLERTTSGTGLAARHTFAELRALDAGCGERIPTLREVVETIGRRAFLNIELKGRGTAGPVARLVAEFVRERGWAWEDFLVSSFLRRELRRLRAEGDPCIPVGVLMRVATRFGFAAARRLGAAAVNPALGGLTRRWVERAHAEGRRVFVFTVNAPEDLARMREWGVDGVFCDFPERVRR